MIVMYHASIHHCILILCSYNKKKNIQRYYYLHDIKVVRIVVKFRMHKRRNKK